VYNKVTVAELEGSVPTAPVLADFHLDAEGPSTAEVLSTAVVLGTDEETDAAPLTSRDSSDVLSVETIERTDCETVENVVTASDTPGPGYGDMSRGLRQLEPHFFLSKVGVKKCHHQCDLIIFFILLSFYFCQFERNFLVKRYMQRDVVCPAGMWFFCTKRVHVLF
jgi:hypothetical protein